MIYKEGQLLRFQIYETTVEGKFIKVEGNSIIIKTTKDFIESMIGKEQRIHKSHKRIKI